MAKELKLLVGILDLPAPSFDLLAFGFSKPSTCQGGGFDEAFVSGHLAAIPALQGLLPARLT